MIYDECGNWQKYAVLGQEELFRTAFEALEKLDADTPEGRIDIVPGKIYINVFSYESRNEEDIKIEIHGRYTDIQRVLDGCEYGVFAPVAGLKELEAYNEAGDYAFFDASKAEKARFSFHPGTFGIFFPGEGHSCCRKGDCERVKKAVVKILW